MIKDFSVWLILFVLPISILKLQAVLSSHNFTVTNYLEVLEQLEKT